jgi:PPOX class probable F420-dependent enzyme
MSDPAPSRRLLGDAVLQDPLVRELLATRLVATLATIEPDGTPYAVAVWYASGEETIVLATGSHSRKVGNIERDQRATLMLHDSRPGLEVCGASIACTAEIVRGQAAKPFVDLVHRRYVTPEGERLPEVVRFLASDDVALLLHPLRAVTWDERGSAAAAALREADAAFPLEPTVSSNPPLTKQSPIN